MAKKVVLVDDFDPDRPASETIVFAFDGESFTVDLCEENAQAFRDVMAPYLEVATKVGKHKLNTRTGNGQRLAAGGRRASTMAKAVASPAATGKPWYKHDANGDPAREKAKKRYRDMARQFGQEHGYDLGERGAVPAEVYQAFEEHRRREGLPVGPQSVGLVA